MFKQKKNIFKLSFILTTFMFVSSVICKLYLCSSLAVKNSELEEAINTRKQLEKEVSRLSFKNSALSSIDLVEKKARDSGFVDMSERLLSIDPNAPVQVAVLK
ncbi:MAG: hypothetical protein WAX66_00815 [Patescibacteria group bacterium]